MIRACVYKHMRHITELPGKPQSNGIKEIRFVRTRYRHSDTEKLLISSNVTEELDNLILSSSWDCQSRWGYGTFDSFNVTFNSKG